MWNTETMWFEVAMVSFFYVLGHIFFGHFEERGPKWRMLAKYVVTLVVVIAISASAGRAYALGLLGLSLLPVIYIHAIVLPRNGINGWTGEPRAKYYEFRGWDKDIFKS